MVERESWYKLTSGATLEQGDILFAVPVIQLPVDFPWPLESNTAITQQPEIHAVNAAVMSQTCDLQHEGKLEFITLCPVYSLVEHPQFIGSSKKDERTRREDLRRGLYPAYHLLDECRIPGHERGFMVVEFRRIFSLSAALTRRLAREQDGRLRLLSPYKEHLSQAFARFFMRVGLPADIPPFR